MAYNAKNYTEQGGEVTHIGGKLVIDEGGEVEGLPSSSVTVPAATASKIGGVKKASAVAALSDDAVLADVVAKVNAILTALKASGAMTD